MNRLDDIYRNKPVLYYCNGRTAQYELLKSLDLPSGSNIAMQAFTCNAVANPILWLGLEPLYVDISKDTFSMDLEDLMRKVDGQTKAIILQHTFGIPGPIDEVMEFARERGIIVLEDCAHALGSIVNGKTLGTTGDAALLSFGLEKTLSSRVGGALVINNDRLIKNLLESYKTLPNMGPIETLVWLANPVVWRVLRKFGTRQMRIAAKLSRMGLLNMGYFPSELRGEMPRGKYGKRLSRPLMSLVESLVSELSQNLEHRRKISAIYNSSLAKNKYHKEIAFVRFPYLCKSTQQRDDLIKSLADDGFRGGDWYNPVLYPAATDMKALKYNEGSCPVAESVAKVILNLPTGRNITKDSAKKIVEIVKNAG